MDTFLMILHYAATIVWIVMIPYTGKYLRLRIKTNSISDAYRLEKLILLCFTLFAISFITYLVTTTV